MTRLLASRRGVTALAAQLLALFAAITLPARVADCEQTRRAAKLELKFQNELDNSTVLKLVGQQQVFKCQVRLAPSNQLETNAVGDTSQASRGRLSSTVKFIEAGNFEAVQTSSPNSSKLLQQVSNATLVIDWFRDNQLVGGGVDEPVTVLNVSLKSSRQETQQRNRNKTRIEIKNTSNSNQLKLASRLKLSHLRADDSGRYKCVARATFNQTGAGEGAKGLLAVVQSLESNGTTLLVSSSGNSGNNKEAGGKLSWRIKL